MIFYFSFFIFYGLLIYKVNSELSLSELMGTPRYYEHIAMVPVKLFELTKVELSVSLTLSNRATPL